MQLKRFTAPVAFDAALEPLVSVVVVAFRSADTLGRCLAALRAQTYSNFEILLIDNGCNDGAALAAHRRWPEVQLLEPGENLGFAAGANRGAIQANGQWLALLNPDAFPEPTWLEKLVDAARRRPAFKCFTSRQRNDDNPTILDGMGDVMFAAGIPFRGGFGGHDPAIVAEGEVFSPCGAAMMIDRALFLGMGGFDESFFCYCEDVDLGYRLRLVGEPTLVVPDAIVRHKGSASSGGSDSQFVAFHGTRNRLWVLLKNTPWPLLGLVLPAHLLALGFSLLRSSSDATPTHLRALRSGFANSGPALSARRRIQKTRTASTLEIARAMTWSPRSWSRTRIVIRPPRSAPIAKPAPSI